MGETNKGQTIAAHQLKEEIALPRFAGLPVAEHEGNSSFDLPVADFLLHGLQELPRGLVSSRRKPADVQQRHFLTLAHVLAKWTSGLDLCPDILP